MTSNDFNSRVNPQIDLNDEGVAGDLASLQAILESYNTHNHAIASSGDPLNMGIRPNMSCQSVEDYLPSGTSVNEVNNNTVLLSESAISDSDRTRLIFDDKLIIDNCSLTQGSNEVNFSAQKGFIDGASLLPALTEDVNGVISNLQSISFSESLDFLVFFVPEQTYYLNLANFVVSGSSESNLTLSIILNDSESEVGERELISNETISSSLGSPFVFNNQNENTDTLVGVESDYDQIIIRVHSADSDVRGLSYYLKMYKSII
jgi:hypothetical protein